MFVLICVFFVLYCSVVEKPNWGLELRISISYKFHVH